MYDMSDDEKNNLKTMAKKLVLLIHTYSQHQLSD